MSRIEVAILGAGRLAEVVARLLSGGPAKL